MPESDYWPLTRLLATRYPWRDKTDRVNRAIICLFEQPDEQLIREYLKRKIIPGLVVERRIADPKTSDTEFAKLRAVLETLTGLLATAGDQRIRKFPRYRLVVSLTAKRAGIYTDKKIRAMLDDSWADAAAPQFGIALVDLPMRVLWLLLGKARLSGRVPIASGTYRWIAESGNGDAIAVARMLIGDSSHYTRDFLVKSFMDDIRVAYHSRKRTACCTLILSNITEKNGSHKLLEAIAQVRLTSDSPDPLLIVAVYDDQTTPPPEVPSVSLAEDEPNSDKFGPPNGAVNGTEPDDINPPAPNPPRLQKTAVAAAMVAAVVIFLILAFCSPYRPQRCGSGWSWPWTNSTLTRVQGECVGVTEPSTDAFPIFSKELTTIAGQNTDAETVHRATGRPIITLVYLGTLTAPDYGDESLTTEREGLRGIAVAQSWQLNPTVTSPLLKVLVANGGQKMSSGPDVAKEIVSWPHDDPKILGVVGLSESYKKTLETVSVLAGAGIPSIGATVSDDKFADTLPLYFQIPPQNKREAAVVAAYLKQNWTPGHPPQGDPVRIYRSDDPADIYSENIASDVATDLTKAGFHTQQIEFTPDRDQPHQEDPSILHLDNAIAAGQNACDFRGLVFYAGRPLPDFGDFLKGSESCSQPVALRIIADDDTTRYVADNEARSQYPAIAFDYVSFATIPSQAIHVEGGFNRVYNKMFGAETQKSSNLDGHAALAFDAAETFPNAIRESGQSAPSSPATVAREIPAMDGFLGATGPISFTGSPIRRVPIDKAVLLLQVRPGKELQIGAYCGPPPPQEPRTASWCPHD